ncbi:hypothetical protein MNBD_GAMMA12-2625 [hydrothermal vent metagenome]|uniref:Uncharacterized protein n=1 Tax=hydrothermal vent metagenome TaxID=652676 RepID=A0A3B0YXP4_9ZZZZ
MLKKTLVFLVFLQSLLFNVHASSVLPLNLEQLSAKAMTIFNGRCISNQVEFDTQSNLVVTYTTFEVLDSIKGTKGLTHTIKQVGGNLPNSNIKTRWPSIPKFIIGNEYVMFLPAASSLGFSTPVGLEQGKFNVLTDALGKQVSNGKNFDALIKDIPSNKIPAVILNRMSLSLASQSLNTSTEKVEVKKLSLVDLLSVVRSIEAAK